MQLRLTREQKRLYDFVDETAKWVELKRGVQVSAQTRLLLVGLLDAVRSDPPPSAPVDRAARALSYDGLQRTLSIRLEQLIDEQVAGDQVTFFDTLRWLVANLDTIYPLTGKAAEIPPPSSSYPALRVVRNGGSHGHFRH
jgi:hypothetical protein